MLENGSQMLFIDDAQVLLKEHFPEMGGLQRTTLGHTLTYAVERGEFVQLSTSGEITGAN